MDEVVKFEYMKSNKSIFVQEETEYLQKSTVITLNDWNQLFSEQKSKYPGFLVTVLDRACQQVFGQKMTYELTDAVMAFQNNNSNIKKVGEVFLHNPSMFCLIFSLLTRSICPLQYLVQRSNFINSTTRTCSSKNKRT